MNILQLNDILKAVSMKVPTVNSYYSRDVYEVWNTTEVKYGSMAFNLQNTRQTDKSRTFEGVLYYADRLTEDNSNFLDIYADADNAIANVLFELKDMTEETEFEIGDFQIVHFQQKFADMLAGGYATITITVSNGCDVVLLQELVDRKIFITTNGEYDVTNYSTAVVNVGIEEETDPIFTASPAHSITYEDIEKWNEGVAPDLSAYVTKKELVQCGYITDRSIVALEYDVAKAISYLYSLINI